MNRTIVALFDRLADDEQLRRELLVCRELQEAGVSANDIMISAPDSGSAEAAVDADREPRGVLGWLFGVPEADTAYYRRELERGRMLVSVRASEALEERVRNILERYNPVDVDTKMGRAGAREETTVPVVEEELAVGKRAVETGRVRVRSYVIERPVEAEVQLREEHVRVERRPASDTAVGDDAFKERSFEVTERSEEVVVSKTPRVTEEVVIRKEADERTETVKDTVRKTEVAVEPAGTAPKRP